MQNKYELFRDTVNLGAAIKVVWDYLMDDRYQQLEEQVNQLNRVISDDLKFYADKVADPQALVQKEIELRNALLNDFHKLEQRNYVEDAFFLLSLAYLTQASYYVARAGVKVAANRYSMWQMARLDTKLQNLLELFQNLSADEKEKMVECNLAIKDSSNNFFLHYLCPISLGLIVEPVVVRIEKTPGYFVLELYDKTSIKSYLENKTNPLSPLTRRPLCKIDDQYWSKPNEDVISDYNQYIESLTEFLYKPAPSQTLLFS